MHQRMMAVSPGASAPDRLQLRIEAMSASLGWNGCLRPSRRSTQPSARNKEGRPTPFSTEIAGRCSIKEKTMTKKVHDIMHAGVEIHAPDTALTAIAKTMKTKDIGAVPILDKGKLVGMVTDRDIAIRALAGGRDVSKLTAKDVMTRNVACCHESDSAASASRTMQERRIRRLAVIDESDKLIGMVSLGDLTHAMSEELSGRLAKAVSAHHA
jgi:CBS domain-containing protein